MACLLLASAAFTACDEDFKDWADPQSNPQEEAITAMVDITPVASMKLEEQPGDSVVIASVSSIAENFSLTACNIELVAEGQILNLPSKVKDGNIVSGTVTDFNGHYQVKADPSSTIEFS